MRHMLQNNPGDAASALENPPEGAQKAIGPAVGR